MVESFNYLIPVEGDAPNVIDTRGYSSDNIIELTGLSHKSISLKLYRGKDNMNVKNEVATKIAQYLMNPCAIYTDIEVYGDVMIRIESSNVIPGRNSREKMASIMKMIESIYESKDSGIMPDYIRDFCMARLADIKQNKQYDRVRKHIECSLASYGKKGSASEFWP